MLAHVLGFMIKNHMTSWSSWHKLVNQLFYCQGKSSWTKNHSFSSGKDQLRVLPNCPTLSYHPSVLLDVNSWTNPPPFHGHREAIYLPMYHWLISSSKETSSGLSSFVQMELNRSSSAHLPLTTPQWGHIFTIFAPCVDEFVSSINSLKQYVLYVYVLLEFVCCWPCWPFMFEYICHAICAFRVKLLSAWGKSAPPEKFPELVEATGVRIAVASVATKRKGADNH